jgi:hypothetical protein
MRLLAIALAALILLGCSKITQENYARIQEGMSEAEVIGVLGNPTESQSISVLGVSGTAARWVANDAVITVQFVNGKARLKFFDKPAPAKK